MEIVRGQFPVSDYASSQNSAKFSVWIKVSALGSCDQVADEFELFSHSRWDQSQQCFLLTRFKRLPIQDECDGRDSRLFGRVVDQEPPVTRDGVLSATAVVHTGCDPGCK